MAASILAGAATFADKLLATSYSQQQGLVPVILGACILALTCLACVAFCAGSVLGFLLAHSGLLPAVFLQAAGRQLVQLPLGAGHPRLAGYLHRGIARE